GIVISGPVAPEFRSDLAVSGAPCFAKSLLALGPMRVALGTLLRFEKPPLAGIRGRCVAHGEGTVVVRRAAVLLDLLIGALVGSELPPCLAGGRRRALSKGLEPFLAKNETALAFVFEGPLLRASALEGVIEHAPGLGMDGVQHHMHMGMGLVPV